MGKLLTAIFIGPLALAMYFWRHRNDKLECRGSMPAAVRGTEDRT